MVIFLKKRMYHILNDVLIFYTEIYINIGTGVLISP